MRTAAAACGGSAWGGWAAELLQGGLEAAVLRGRYSRESMRRTPRLPKRLRSQLVPACGGCDAAIGTTLDAKRGASLFRFGDMCDAVVE